MASYNMKTNVGKAVLRSRESNVNSTIPSSIPVQPTLKTIRSPSYSVSRQDYDAPVSLGLPSSAVSSTFAGRDRQHSAALQHRPLRPSMLSEVSNENIGLGNVKEVEDDDDESTTDGSSLHGGAGYNANEITYSYFSSGSIFFPLPAPEYRHTSSLAQPAVYRPSTMPPHFGGFMHSQARRDQALYIVSFKASRSDVFYLQENTGLQVRVGDLVIVEADRGCDLGTVSHAGLSWDEARKQKENADEEHYKWLMMYSQFSQEQSTDAPCAGMMFFGNGEVSSAVGGLKAVMAPHMKAIRHSGSGEIQPKIIKRVAQAHEVAALRQKEGDEAEAKKVCIQKAREHGIPMEILDCDFQTDGKKITFYYYAESCVNFNILVQDLFKVYGIRIWMSAVNHVASFGTISAGHQAPSGIGPGAIGVRNGQWKDQIQQYSSRGYDSGYGQTFPAVSDRALMAPQQSFQATSDFSYGYPPFAVGPRTMNAPIASYNPSMQQMDAYNGSRESVSSERKRALDERERILDERESLVVEVAAYCLKLRQSYE